MTRVRGFRFDGRPSPARHWDIRFRVAATAVVSAALVGAPAPALVPLTAMVAGLLASAHCRPREAMGVVAGIFPFLVFFVVLGWVFEPNATHLAFLGVQSVRLTLLLLLGHFMYLPATPFDVTEGIRWYLGWLGRRRAWMAASMASWALAAVPLVLDQAEGLLEAAASRGFQVRRHPLRAARLVTLGLLIRTMGRSTDLAAALEARNFGNSVPPPSGKARWSDALALLVVILTTVASWGVGEMLS